MLGETLAEKAGEQRALEAHVRDLRAFVHLGTEALAVELARAAGEDFDALQGHARRDFIAVAGGRVQARQELYGQRLAAADTAARAALRDSLEGDDE